MAFWVVFSAAACHRPELHAPSSPSNTASTSIHFADNGIGEGVQSAAYDENGAFNAMFRRSQPIATADPRVRTNQDVAVPKDVRIRFLNSGYAIDFPVECFETVRVSVGTDMVTAWESKLFIVSQGSLPANDDRPYSFGLSGGLDNSTQFIRPGSGWTPQNGVKYSVFVRLRLFETDIPPEHMWDPYRGEFSVLWSRELRRELP